MRVRKSVAQVRWRLGRPHVVLRIVVIVSLLASWGSVARAQDPQLVRMLQGLLQKYQKCILEQYENQVGENGADKTNPRALGPLRDPAICVAGNTCTRASRQDMYNRLKAQADRGDPTNFEVNLKTAILNDCFQCAKHGEYHTKQMHCALECKGDQSWSENPFKFDAGVGPCFEGCKAGVDITKLVNDVANDIRGVIQSISSGNSKEPTSASGGPTIATNYEFVTPPKENCDFTLSKLGPPAYFMAPRDMLDWTPELSHTLGEYDLVGFKPSLPPTPAMYDTRPGRITGSPGSILGANEGRVRAELRAVAVKKDPIYSLCQAAQRFTRDQPASGNTPSDRDFGDAFADLSVTGKASFAKFVQLHPTEAILRGHQACAGASESSISTALDRAYLVASALRGPHDSQQRRVLGWIAVSGEDDQPYRPVNVPTNRGHFPDFQIKVTVPKWPTVPPINTRYMIAQAHPAASSLPAKALAVGGVRNLVANFPSAVPLVDGGTRKVPADPTPTLANDAEVLLFIHGMDSRLEEADDLTEAMHRLPGHNWTVIAMDLPTSGYADNIDHRRISPITAVQCHNTPLVDFVEDFIVAFVDTLDSELHGQLKPRIKAVVGGSLGGNMAMRLGRRQNTPWITHVVPWSPAAIWPSMIAQHNAIAAGCDTGWDMLKDRAVNQSLKWAGLEERFLPDHETPELRRELFYGGWDWAPVGGLGGPPQAQCWFSNGYDCRSAEILASRIDRQETYDANFRAWHWRLGGEQLAFSQQQFAPGTQTPLYLLNTKRMLLLSGCEDKCGQLGPDTQEVAKKMVNTPGYARFLQLTGHSLDNEHPNWVARQIADFLEGR